MGATSSGAPICSGFTTLFGCASALNARFNKMIEIDNSKILRFIFISSSFKLKINKIKLVNNIKVFIF
jgi:hypothetical protein